MSISAVFDCLVEDKRFVNSGCNISRIINNGEFIKSMINRLSDITSLPSEFLETFFGPENEDLIRSYQPNGGLKLSEHIKSRLCPDNFFPLKDAGIDVSEELQQDIFKLLSLKQIVDILIKERALTPGFNFLQIFKSEQIIKKLRDKVVWDHETKLENILIKIPELAALPKHLKDDHLFSHRGICKVIREMIANQQPKSN